MEMGAMASSSSSGEDGVPRSPLISSTQRRKGGLITMPFIIANEALARVATTGILPNMVLYLMGDYRFHIAKATKILLLSSAAGNFTPLIGAFVGDSYLGRFLSVGLGSFFVFLGISLFWLTAMIPQARPPPCNQAKEMCPSATAGQMALLISCFVLNAIGSGGFACSLAFGADQLNRKDNPNNPRVLEIFFSWYYASTAISVIIAFTGIVYIQDHFGWKLGFGVPAALMFLSTFVFFLASPIYIKLKPTPNLITGLVRVVVASYKNRKLQLPPKNSAGRYHHKEDSDLLVPSDKLRFLNKACVIQDQERDIAADGSARNPWSLCTTEEVEELKAIIKVIPIWSSGIMMSVNANQGSFALLQAKSLDRHITPSFEIPAGSMTVIVICTIFVWVGIYDRILIPLASKIRGKPVRIPAKWRIGLGLLCYFFSLVGAAVVENIRRRRAIEEGHLNDPNAVLNMSIWWIIPLIILGGIAEAFNIIGQNEFFYSEFPRTMSSLSSSLVGLGMAAGNVVSTIVFTTVDDVTSGGGRESWVADNINRGRYDKYYWILVAMHGVNLVYYLFCSWSYGSTSGEISNGSEENGSREEEFTESGIQVKDEKDEKDK